MLIVQGPTSPMHNVVMKPLRRLVPIVAALALAGCGASGDDGGSSPQPDAGASTRSKTSAPAMTPAAPTPSKTTASPSKTAAKDDEASQWAAKIKTFESENGIGSSQWYPLVTSTEVKSGNSLWIYTKINPDGDAETAAAPICGGYSLFALDEPDVSTIFVRASDGQQIAKCGPGA